MSDDNTIDYPEDFPEDLIDPKVKIKDPSKPRSLKELQAEAELKVEPAPVREFDPDAPVGEVLAAIDHPVGVIDEDEDLILGAGEQPAPVAPNEDVHIVDNDVHIENPGDHVDPPQDGESEPPDLDELIRQEQRERLIAIKESPIGNPPELEGQEPSLEPVAE